MEGGSDKGVKFSSAGGWVRVLKKNIDNCFFVFFFNTERLYYEYTSKRKQFLASAFKRRK